MIDGQNNRTEVPSVFDTKFFIPSNWKDLLYDCITLSFAVFHFF